MRATIVAIICFLSANVCRAQIVNIESSRMQSDTVGWMGNVGADVSFNKAVDKIFQGNLETHVQYKTRRDLGLWLILGDIGFLKINNTRVASDGLLHIRYNKKVNNWLRWEFFTQFQNNVITQIDSRFLLGTGPRFKLSQLENFKLYVGCLLMYERELERTVPKITHNDIRNSSYLSFSWLPKSYLELTSTTYFQPLIRKFSDYRIMNQIAFKVKATPHFSLSLKWNYLHDRFPAGTAPRTTYSFSTGVNYDL